MSGIYGGADDWETVYDPVIGAYTYVRKKPQPKVDDGCCHEFENYTGFTEVYRYCKRCDAKEPTP